MTISHPRLPLCTWLQKPIKTFSRRVPLMTTRWNVLRVKTHATLGTVRSLAPYSASAQPSDLDLGRRHIVTPVAEIMSPDQVSNSHLPSRTLPFRVLHICRRPTGSINPARCRSLGILRSVGTRWIPSDSVYHINMSPLALRYGFSAGPVRMSHPTIRLESLWNTPDKTLPLDMCMNPKGILVDDHGSFGSVDCSQAELMVLRCIPHAKLLHTPSSLLSDDNDFVFPYLHITDIVEESSESTSQGYPIFTVVGLNKYSPGGTTALVTTTVSAPVETDTPVIAHVFIPDATQASAEDVQPENLAKDNTSYGLEDSFSYVTSASSEVASDAQIPGFAYIPSLEDREARPVATKPLYRTDRSAKCFSASYLPSVRQLDHGLFRTPTFSSSFPDARASRNLRALADLISLLDAASETAETTGVSEIHMGS
jgi:hypothetical protein